MLLLFSSFVFSQYGYKPQHEDGIEVGGWDKSTEFNRAEIDRVDINFLKKTFLNKEITPVFVKREFREYSYKNFFKTKKLKKIFKDNSYRGLKSHSSNGSGGTMVLYDPQNNYRQLFGKVFLVKNIEPITHLKHISNSDDSNFIFTIYNSEIGEIYYKYNSKFIDQIEIKLFWKLKQLI